MGITSVLVFLAGKIEKAKFRNLFSDVEIGARLGSIESVRYFGAVRSPVVGKVAHFNEVLEKRPSLLSESPYGDGWFAEYEWFDRSSLSHLYRGQAAKEKLEERIKELKVRCFKLLPDVEMYAIGIECSATLANLDELLSKHPSGYVVHLVTDDPMADIEMVRWSMQTKNELAESRTEDNLFHFIVRKE